MTATANWLLTLPWEAWSALASWGTFLAGTAIAAIAARATWLQFHGTFQVEITDVVVVSDRFGERLVTVLVSNRSPFTITFVWWAVRARTWAYVAYPPDSEPALGNDRRPMLTRIGPREQFTWTFALGWREGVAPFTVDLWWGRHGRFGRLHKTTTKGRPG